MLIFNYSLDDYKQLYNQRDIYKYLALFIADTKKDKKDNSIIVKLAKNKKRLFPIYSKKMKNNPWKCKKILDVYELSETWKKYTPDSFYKYIECELKKYQIKYE